MAPSISATLVVAELALRARLVAAGRVVYSGTARVLGALVTLLELLVVSVVLRLAHVRRRARNR